MTLQQLICRVNTWWCTRVPASQHHAGFLTSGDPMASGPSRLVLLADSILSSIHLFRTRVTHLPDPDKIRQKLRYVSPSTSASARNKHRLKRPLGRPAVPLGSKASVLPHPCAVDWEAHPSGHVFLRPGAPQLHAHGPESSCGRRESPIYR